MLYDPTLVGYQFACYNPIIHGVSNFCDEHSLILDVWVVGITKSVQPTEI